MKYLAFCSEDWTFAVVQAINSRSTSPASLLDTPEGVLNSIRPKSRIRSVRFAHPAESVIAELLDTHGIRWLYEPTTFPLETTDDGRPLQSFTPDFYLPDCDTYIEMTTMRQSLVTRKNRKFRMLRERHPELNVRLLYRRDVELISNHYRAQRMAPDALPGSVLISEETIRRRLEEWATAISPSIDGNQIVTVALGRNAKHVTTELSAGLRAVSPLPITQVVLDIKRPRATLAEIDFGLSDQVDPNAFVILVADVIGTGLTSYNALAWLAERNIAVQLLVALADRRSARLIDLPISASLVAAPSSWLIGAGVGGAALANLHLVDYEPSA